MKRRFITYFLCLMAVMFFSATDVMAQRKTTRSKKAKVTRKKTKTAEPKLVSVPIDSLIGRDYYGVVGKTVVDFFGSRKTYGELVHEIYVASDSNVVFHYKAGDTETFTVMPYTYNGAILTVNGLAYQAVQGGAALNLPSTKENGESRQGRLTRCDASLLINETYKRGNYIDRSGDLTEEEQRQAYLCVAIAADAGHAEAREYLTKFYQRAADNGDVSAVKWLLARRMKDADYTAAHALIDSQIEREPQSAYWLCEKGLVYIAQNDKSAAKKLLKRVKKLDVAYYDEASHPFLQEMLKK